MRIIVGLNYLILTNLFRLSLISIFINQKHSVICFSFVFFASMHTSFFSSQLLWHQNIKLIAVQSHNMGRSYYMKMLSIKFSCEELWLWVVNWMVERSSFFGKFVLFCPSFPSIIFLTFLVQKFQCMCLFSTPGSFFGVCT